MIMLGDPPIPMQTGSWTYTIFLLFLPDMVNKDFHQGNEHSKNASILWLCRIIFIGFCKNKGHCIEDQGQNFKTGATVFRGQCLCVYISPITFVQYTDSRIMCHASDLRVLSLFFNINKNE